jgi:hypothetical protein
MGMEPSSEGRQLADQYADIDLALGASHQGINVLAALLSDRAPNSNMAQSTDVQVGEGEPAIRDCQPPRELFTDPEAKPARNNKVNMSSDDPEGDPNMTISSNNSLPPLVVNGSINQEAVALNNPSYLASSRTPPADRQCMACTENFTAPNIFTSPCSHEYCRICITRIVTEALQDLSTFPPKCCDQRIPVEHGVWFSQKLVDQFQAREVEQNTQDRTYCSEPSCATFIPPTEIAPNLARCPTCSRGTCARCKAPYHWGACPQDRASSPLLRLAKEHGWQRCPSCGQLIERRDGCIHMSESLYHPVNLLDPTNIKCSLYM